MSALRGMDQLRIYAILAIRAVRPAVHPAVNNFVIVRSMPCAPPRSVPPAKLPLMWQLAVARYVSYRSTRLYTEPARVDETDIEAWPPHDASSNYSLLSLHLRLIVFVYMTVR